MVGNESILFAYLLYQISYPGVTHLSYLSALSINEMIMGSLAIGLFILSLVMAKLVSHYQPAVKKQVNGIIQGGSGDPVVLVLHEIEE